jgi:tRNA(fMet)-specific endonuclease VapC
MKQYLLDTNMISHLLRQHPAVLARVQSIPMASLAISVITEAELNYGLARRPDARRLHLAVAELLKRIDILNWDRGCAASYGDLRAVMEANGKSLAAFDLQIAAQARASQRVLVSNDQAFRQVPGMQFEDWTQSSG